MKLWQTGTKTDKEVEEFTVGKDYVYDQILVPYDCNVSMAHSKLLLKMKIINKKEYAALNAELKKIIKSFESGKFKLKQGDEDVHTKIENTLTKKLGGAGKKIHALRSRNDQVVTSLQLYSKDKILQTQKEVVGLIQELNVFAQKMKGMPMPGYTHMQRAMPSSVSLWAGAFVESLKLDMKALKLAFEANDQNPLGSAAGYGLPVNIDKTITTKELGFSKHFTNPLYVQNARGKMELTSIFALMQTMFTLNKLASDLMLFTTKEFGFFTLPKAMCTGSSIMPQKNNYDVFEIMRANLSAVCGNFYSVCSNAANLPSGYNRDIQLNKGKLMESFEITINSLRMAQKIAKSLLPKEKSLRNAISEEMYDAQQSIKLAMDGIPFREAYKKIKLAGNGSKRR